VQSDNGVDWSRYDFRFAAKRVVDWELTREISGGVAPWRADDARGVSKRVPPSPTPALGESRKGISGSTMR
jgi:hypothetical protein